MIGHPLDTIKVGPRCLSTKNSALHFFHFRSPLPYHGQVRMQKSSEYTSALNCARRTLHMEGFAGFFKGLAPPLVSVAMYQACAAPCLASLSFLIICQIILFFACFLSGFLILSPLCFTTTLYLSLSLFVVDAAGTSAKAICFASFNSALKLFSALPEAEAAAQELFAAGCLAGAATTLVTTPSDLVKIRLQLQGAGAAGAATSGAVESSSGSSSGAGSASPKASAQQASVRYRGMAHCAASVLAAEGPRGLYRGFVATLYRDTGSTGLYFLVYHGTKRRLQEWGGESGRGESGGGAAAGASAGSSAGAELCAGGCAGVAAWGAVLPFDVAKTRLQSQAGG